MLRVRGVDQRPQHIEHRFRASFRYFFAHACNRFERGVECRSVQIAKIGVFQRVKQLAVRSLENNAEFRKKICAAALRCDRAVAVLQHGQTVGGYDEGAVTYNVNEPRSGYNTSIINHTWLWRY